MSKTKPARVTGPPSGRITTTDAINRANAEFWRETSAAPRMRLPGEAAIVAEAFLGQLKGEAKAKATKAGKSSGRARRRDNVKRDQQIHDAHARGLKLKAIADAHGIAHTTVSRILKQPLP